MTSRYHEALQFIPAYDRVLWVEVGFALHSEGIPFEVWDEWSKSADNYCPKAAKSTWKSFKHGAVTIGSLYHRAREYGWRDSGKHKPLSHEELAEKRRIAEQRFTEDERKILHDQKIAANKANNILSYCELSRHGYLESHGFKDEKGLVFKREGLDPLLCIPMRYNGEVCGLQLIGSTGEKKFLRGQQCSEAEFIFGNSGRDFYCEGWATGKAVFTTLSALKITARVRVCFSAANLVKVAKKAGAGLVVADLEPSGTGVRAAIATELPYWVSDRAPKDDFCDVLQREGLFRATQLLRKFLQENRK